MYCPMTFGLLCTYDIEWRNKFISALDKIIACCLKTPKHCLARSWLIIIARSYAEVIPCLCLHYGILKLHIQKNTVPWPFEGAIHLSLLYSLTKAHQCGKWIDIEIAHRLALGAGVAWATTAPGAKPWPISILPRSFWTEKWKHTLYTVIERWLFPILRDDTRLESKWSPTLPCVQSGMRLLKGTPTPSTHVNKTFQMNTFHNLIDVMPRY